MNHLFHKKEGNAKQACTREHSVWLECREMKGSKETRAGQVVKGLGMFQNIVSQGVSTGSS